jgi:hypothetical protein
VIASPQRLLYIFLIALAAAIGAKWALSLLTGEAYRFPDGWVIGAAVGIAAMIGARLRAQGPTN